MKTTSATRRSLGPPVGEMGNPERRAKSHGQGRWYPRTVPHCPQAKNREAAAVLAQCLLQPVNVFRK